MIADHHIEGPLGKRQIGDVHGVHGAGAIEVYRGVFEPFLEVVCQHLLRRHVQQGARIANALLRFAVLQRQPKRAVAFQGAAIRTAGIGPGNDAFGEKTTESTLAERTVKAVTF